MRIFVTGDSLVKRVKTYLPAQLLSHDVDVQAFPGATIQRLAQRIQSMGNRFDVILVHIGTNNSSCTVEQCITEYESLFDCILRVNPTAHVIVSSVLPRQRDLYSCVGGVVAGESLARVNSKFSRVNEQLSRFCGERSNFTFCESRSSWDGCMAKDGLHLNDRGTQALARLFEESLRNTIGDFMNTKLTSMGKVGDCHYMISIGLLISNIFHN